MRMRRKKHLSDRLERIKNYFLVIERDVTNVNEAIKDKKIIDYKTIFGNDNPVEMDIGCGKGGFIVELAKANPDKNYIAVEMMENIILLAGETAEKENLKNLKFINTGAEYLPRYIAEKSISAIYLNFSPPYPQKSYSNRRLTNKRFLGVYSGLLKDDGYIYQKTDDKDFYEYSFESFNGNGFIAKELYGSDTGKEYKSIITEYESKFRAKGMPIYGLYAKKNLQNI